MSHHLGTSKPLSEQQLEQYARVGYLVLPNFVTAAVLDELTRECMEAWEQEKGAFDANGTWLHNALLANIHHRSPAALEYYVRGPLVDVVEQLIGPNIKGAATQLTFKLRGNTMPFGWHQDNGYGQLEPANAVTALTAFDNADQENGCLWLIPGSHRGGQIDVSDRLTPEAKAAGADLSVTVDDPTLAKPIEMEAGDVLLFHCHLLHRSDGNRSTTRDRRILFLRYADADAVEVYNESQPRLGPLLRGCTRFPEVEAFEKDLVNASAGSPSESVE